MPHTNPSAAHEARSTSSRIIRVTSLSSQDFAQFGQVIQNPSHHGRPTELKKVTANQGTATKWLDVTDMTNWYAGNAPSGKEAKVVVNMFVCRRRELMEREGKKVFPVKILERHPHTPQTFVPMGVAVEDEETRYLVVVAPTLSDSENVSRARSRGASASKSLAGSLEQRLYDVQLNPYITHEEAVSTLDDRSGSEDNEAVTDQSISSHMQPKGTGGPDLDNIQAFIARGDQAVTYGPGTWHAPMVVLGHKEIDFVVVQYSNGVALEDCQEHDVHQDIAVDIRLDDAKASAPGIMRAKM